MPEPSFYLFILGQSVVPIVLILFFFKREKSRADHLFMAWMALSIFSSGLFLWQRWQGPGVSHPSQTIRADQVLATLDIVFLYFYCSHLLSRNYKTRKVDFLTLLPFGIAVLLWISHLFWPGDLFKIDSQYPSSTPIHLQFLMNVLVLVSFVMTVAFLFKANLAGLSDRVSKRHLFYLKGFLVSGALNHVLIISLHFLAEDILKLFKNDLFFYSNAFMVLTSIGHHYFAYCQRSIFKVPVADFATNTCEDQGASQIIFNKIRKCMEEDKPYLNSNFSVSQLAMLVGENPNYISKALSQYGKTNFLAFVSQYRVREVKQIMTDPAYQNYTLVSIGLEAGFNSKATFNRTFKKIEGITPSAYRDQLKDQPQALVSSQAPNDS